MIKIVLLSLQEKGSRRRISLKKKPKTKKTKKKTVVSLATFVALQVWYGIPNERVPKSPLK